MGFCVLFGLLLCFLAFNREGVWTTFTPQDVARWQHQAETGDETPAARHALTSRHPLAISQPLGSPVAAPQEPASGRELANVA